MAVTFISSLSSFLGLGVGKDRYTQTPYNFQTHTYLGKQTQTVNVGLNDLFGLYDSTTQLSAPINMKASMYSTGVWKHKRLGRDGKPELIENSPIVAKLSLPNAIQSGREFMRQEAISYSIYGNSICYANRSGFVRDAIPNSLWVLPFDRLEFDRTGKIFKQTKLEDIISRVRMRTDNGGFEDYELNNLVWMRNTNPNDPVMGMSLIPSLTMEISNIRGAKGFRNRIITNDAALGILSSEMKDGMGIGLDENEQKRINEGYKARYGMQQGKDNIMMTEANIRWNPMSYPTKDLLLFEEVDADFQAIIDAYGLNKNIFSFSQSSTFENVNQGLKSAYLNTIIPFAESRAEAWSRFFGMDYNKEWLEIDYSHIPVLQDDKLNDAKVDKAKAETYQILNANGRKDLADALYE